MMTVLIATSPWWKSAIIALALAAGSIGEALISQ